MTTPMQHTTAALLALALSAACTGFEPGSDVLGDREGLARPEAPPGEDWSCLEGADLREAPALPTLSSAATRVIFSAQILDLSTGAIYPDITVRACGISDIDCTAPVAGGLTVDGNGWVDIPLFQGFTGFFEFESPALLSTVFFVTEQVAEQTRQSFPFVVVSTASVRPLLTLVGLTQQASTGFLALRARDCTDTPAPGITFSLEGESEGTGTPFYFIGGLPTATAPATDAAGLGGFANVPVGRVVVNATNRDGDPIMPPQSILIREGWLSELVAWPPQDLRTPIEQ